MSKTVKFDFNDPKTIVSLTEEELDKLPMESIDGLLRSYGYDPEQVKLHGRILMKVLFENLDLKRKVAELEKQLAVKNG